MNAELAERWEARLAKEGLAVVPLGQHVHLDTSGHPGGDWLSSARMLRLVSIEHEKLSAAVWRFPFGEYRNQPRRRFARSRPATHKMRTVVRVLARGGTCRQAAHKAHVSLREVVRLKRAVMAWKDPDDGR